MPLKPVDKRIAGIDGHEALWAAIRRHRKFTFAQVHEETRLHQSTSRDYLKGLLNAGYVKKITQTVPVEYELIKDVGDCAPRVRTDGSPVTMGKSREQMWLTMRILGVFTVLDLKIAATTEEHEVSLVDAKDYVRHLTLARYLVNEGDRYRFIISRFSGPRPPQVQRSKQVYDPNLGKVVYDEMDGHQ